ncbi:MAG: impB/mucB/samB family protein [Pseudomonadota bacterium]
MNIKSPHESGLKYLFLDLNSYFASVEQQENPILRGKPIAVTPMVTDATCAIAASYEAKAYGVKTGTKIYEARRLCPGLKCVLARHDKYVEYHHKILDATERHLPVNKVWSIDEFDCILLGREREPDNARALAQNIKESIWRNVGEAINCSIGIAPNSFLAKVATEIEKPDGLVLMHPEDLPGRLLDLKLMDLPGINVGMMARLERARIKTVEQLWNTSPKQARAIWGSVQGERFWYWLHGYDVPYQSTNTSMVGHSRVLDPDLRTPEKARSMARRLLVKAGYRLRRKEFYASRLSLSVRFVDRTRWGHDIQFAAAHDPFTFLHYLNELWEMMEYQCGITDYHRNKTLIKKVSVILHGLKRAEDITDDLLDLSLAEKRKQLKKNEALSTAMDHLQQKYKKETVCIGVPPKTLAGHVGTKIAFSRVPDKEEFWN